ncbi:MAG: 3-phosphoshikimate 1-carboxyvinyltransferase [Lachnospiraceae bacterium]|nr:3-phosphoshikimate 1-carboxyvinyltransferase [Lachnospiraceae bacterium]
MHLAPAHALRGELTVPGDKSVSHRGVMFGALAKGTTRITHFLEGADCLSTIACFRKLGVTIDRGPDEILVHGRGLFGLDAPESILDCGNSGTTMRLLSGILSAQPFSSALTGDASIQKRPMKRILEPLSAMGAQIVSERGNGCAPLCITGSPLRGIAWQSPVASAQVKSALLLAGLYAEGPTSVTEPARSRDHSERMLRAFGADLRVGENTVTIQPARELYAREVPVPGDISSAAYFLAAAALIPDSELLLKNVGTNPTRDGILRVMLEMGADLTLLNEKKDGLEPTADLLIRTSHLHGTVMEGARIPTLIDELPILAVLACFAEGETVIRDAAELKVKESDRIRTVTENLKHMGAEVSETEDGMIIRGGRPLLGAEIECYEDHRIAMSFAVAALAARGETRLKNAGCVRISYPEFFEDLARLQR